VITNESQNCDIYFLVDNFSEQHQIEAPNQPLNRNISEYDCFLPYVENQGKQIVGLVSNRYSNGADIIFVEWMEEQHAANPNVLDMSTFSFAGWNTDGNTLGTVVSNSILLRFFTDHPDANKYFNSLRILEDCRWQAILRQQLDYYVDNVNGDSTNHLNTDLDFYRHWSWKRLNSDYNTITTIFNVDSILKSIYYPWNRTFEIGFNEPTL